MNTPDVQKTIDCVVVGSCGADVLVGPLPLDERLEPGKVAMVDPLQTVHGGVVPNAGIAMARMGLRVAALACLGNDDWADIVLTALQQERISTRAVVQLEEIPSSATLILIDNSGEHFIAHHPGADQKLNVAHIRDNLDLFRESRVALFGYYAILDSLMDELHEALPAIRAAGCRTALDAAGNGGTMQPLDRILPHVDIYLPSLAEARAQAGTDDPREMIRRFRRAGAAGLVGIKLGADGALLSPAEEQWLPVRPAEPPGPVVETIGAGDCFFAGLIAGLVRGWTVEQAGRLAAAAGACCVTQFGASAGIRDFSATARIAGLPSDIR